MRAHIDCGNVIHDQPSKESFCEKLESVQYKAALAIKVPYTTHRQKRIYGVRFRIIKTETMVQMHLLHIHSNYDNNDSNGIIKTMIIQLIIKSLINYTVIN